MEIKRVNIGSEIKKVVEKNMGNHSKFAEKMGISRQNIHTQIYNKHSIDTDKLLRISEILSVNFFKLYCIDDSEVIKNDDKIKIETTIKLNLTKDELIEFGLKDKIIREFNS